MKRILILTILLLLTFKIHSEECAIELKLKPQEDIKYLATEDAEIKKYIRNMI